VLDKNPEKNLSKGIIEAKNIFEKNTINSILCDKPFVKAIFLARLIKTIDSPIIYLDFDLLYNGYTVSGIFSIEKNVMLLRPSKNEWIQVFKMVLLKVSKEKTVVIIDSLNGLFNLLEGKDVGRLVNASIMLLGCVARQSKSVILFASITNQKKGGGWILSPTGRHVVDARKMTRVYLKNQGPHVLMDILDDDHDIRNSIKVI